MGVQRQYCGCVGKTANCQVAVCLVFSSFKGYSIVDFRLYLPKSWINNSERCKQAGVPEDTAFLTKPQLAIEMLSQALKNQAVETFLRCRAYNLMRTA